MTKRKHDRPVDVSLLTGLPPSGEGSDMAREPRPDASGGLHLIIVRGIERKAIICYSIGRGERMQQEDTVLRDHLKDHLNSLITSRGFVQR
jgi:hypothetical protein